jgi:Fur family transcriptional regulator, ferric uptake regulator
MQRKTNQRDAIVQVLEQASDPLTPTQIMEKSQEFHDGLGIATVYRAVKELVETGWLTTVEIAGEPNRFERADKPHHHHFHCRICGQVYDVPGCPGNIRKLTPEGFLLEDHEIILRGVCVACREKVDEGGAKE